MGAMKPVLRLESLIVTTSVPFVTPGLLSGYDRLSVHWGRAIPPDWDTVDTATLHAKKL